MYCHCFGNHHITQNLPISGVFHGRSVYNVDNYIKSLERRQNYGKWNGIKCE